MLRGALLFPSKKGALSFPLRSIGIGKLLLFSSSSRSSVPSLSLVLNRGLRSGGTACTLGDGGTAYRPEAGGIS